MAAVPSIGRADRASRPAAPEADLTRALYEKHANQIFRYCVHQLGSREEAEDAVQSTFLNAFRGIKRGVVPELESAWLFKIAENVCLSRRRSSWRRDRIESPADFEVVEEVTPAPGRLADELIGLQDVLEQMPESQRRAILLREWQGLSYREIAEELELSQSAVETLIFRARRSLAQGLEQPPEPARKRRLVRGADWGNVLAAIKSMLLGGSAAAKVAAAVAVVSASTVVAAAPVQRHARSPHLPASPAPASTPRPTPAPTPGAPAAAAPAAPAPRSAHSLPAAPAPAAPPVPALAPAATIDTSPSPLAPLASDQATAEPPAEAPPVTHREQAPPTPPAGGQTGGTSGSAGQGQGQGQGHGGGQGQGGSPASPPSSPPGQAGAGGDQPGNGNGSANGSGNGGNGAADQPGQGSPDPSPPAQPDPPTSVGGGSSAGDPSGQGASGGQGNGNGNGVGQGTGGGQGS